MPAPKPPYAAIRHPQVLEIGKEIVLDAGAVKSLAFREIQAKEAFTIVDAEGRFFRASVSAIGPGRAQATVYERMAESTESPARITLLCAVLSRQRMLTVVQKATELGVHRIVPVLSAKSVPREGLAHEKAHAWPGQALRAARQCRRATVPEVIAATPLDRALDDAGWKEAAIRVVLDDRVEAAPRLWATDKPDGAFDLAFAVGPEGGWTDAELASISAAGALPLRLGPRVLRAETAVFAGLTVLQHAFGDMR